MQRLRRVDEANTRLDQADWHPGQSPVATLTAVTIAQYGVVQAGSHFGLLAGGGRQQQDPHGNMWSWGVGQSVEWTKRY